MLFCSNLIFYVTMMQVLSIKYSNLLFHFHIDKEYAVLFGDRIINVKKNLCKMTSFVVNNYGSN